MATTRGRWEPGAVYAVPLADGSVGFAQAIDGMMANIIYVALFADRAPAAPDAPPTLKRPSVISLSATWRQVLNRGEWSRIGVEVPVVGKHEFPNERFARLGYIGAKHHDGGLLADFLSAYHGLQPWNVLYEEDYFDRLLAPGVRRPPTARVLTPEERAAYRAQRAPGDQVT